MASLSEPRFYVTELEGWGTALGSHRAGLTTHVHDRVFGHRVVNLWRTEEYSDNGTGYRCDRARRFVRERAHALADRLNREVA